MITSCIVLGHYSYMKPFCIYATSSSRYFCLEELNALLFNNQLNTKAHYLKQIFKTNPHHFSKTNDGRTFVMTPSVIQVARCFNYYYLAELCKLTVDEIIGKVADPLLKCIQYDSWLAEQPYFLEKQSLDLSPLNENESLFTSLTDSDIISKEKQYINRSSRISLEDQAKKHYRPITTTTIQLSTILHRWLSTDVSDHQPGSPTYQVLQSVDKMKLQQQAIIETRQLQAVFTTPTKATRFIKDKPNPVTFPDIKRRRGAYLHYDHQHKKQRLQEKRLLPPPPTPLSHHQQEHNLRLLASQATQMRGLPISPSLSPSSPPTPFLLQPIDSHTIQPLRLPSIRAMLSEIPVHVVDYFA